MSLMVFNEPVVERCEVLSLLGQINDYLGTRLIPQFEQFF